MKRHLATLAAIIAASAAAAGWVPAPVDITVFTVPADLAVATTGTVTSIAAPGEGESYWLAAATVGAILPEPDTVHTAAATNTVTEIAAPPADESYTISAITCSPVLPPAATNTLTLVIDNVTNVFAAAALSAASTQTVSDASAITATLAAGVTNLPVLTFVRTWSPDTNTVTLVFIRDDAASTNTLVLSKASPAASAGFRVEAGDTITATRSGTVTNLPALTFSRIASPLSVTRTLLPHEHWRLWGARPASTVASDASGATLAVSYAYAVASGTPAAGASFTNGAAAAVLSDYAWLSPGDTVTATATGATNSPTLRLMTERFYLREPADQPAP